MIEESLSKLEQRFEQLNDSDLLKKPLSELIKHIKILDVTFKYTEPKIIYFSFFDDISEKLTGKERLMSPCELKSIIDNTLLLLDGGMSVGDYHRYASKLPGHPSPELKNVGIAMMSLAVIIASVAIASALIAIAPFGGVFLAMAILKSLSVGIFFYANSGQSGLCKEVSNVAIAYEKGTICSP